MGKTQCLMASEKPEGFSTHAKSEEGESAHLDSRRIIAVAGLL
jgi:hypothetical protein